MAWIKNFIIVLSEAGTFQVLHSTNGAEQEISVKFVGGVSGEKCSKLVRLFKTLSKSFCCTRVQEVLCGFLSPVGIGEVLSWTFCTRECCCKYSPGNVSAARHELFQRKSQPSKRNFTMTSAKLFNNYGWKVRGKNFLHEFDLIVHFKCLSYLTGKLLNTFSSYV